MQININKLGLNYNKDMDKYIKQLPFYDHLSKKEKEDIIKFSNTKSYSKGTLIHSNDNECLGLIMLIKGSIRIYMLSDEGKEITLYNIEENDIEVLSASCVFNQITFDTELIAKEDCKLLIVSVNYLSKLIEENIYVRSYVYESLADRFSDVMWSIQQILFFKIDQRIASYLIDKANKEKTLTLSTTQENIALEINSAREVVTRMLKKFQKEKLIEINRKEITIIDKENLLKII